ncbi:MAG: MAPEG family protein [Litorimonas sp.]
MEQSVIFQPMLLQATLMVLGGVWLVWARVGSAIRGKVDMKDVEENIWYGWIKNAGDNFNNQFQVPVLFFTLCFILYLTNSVTPTVVVLAWFFAISRICHALVHLTFNHVTTRFLIFFLGVLSVAALLILTIRSV